MIHGIILYCDDQFIIEEVIFNSFQYDASKVLGLHLSQIFNKDDHPKTDKFISKLKDESAVFGWDINVDFEDHIKPLKISGSRINGNYFIMGVETNSDVPFLYEELMKINNDQANFIRSEMKQKFMDRAFNNDDEVYNEMTKLNNELSNMQRELTKKNVELKKLNELKNQFLGMAAHDLRNPLNIILSYSDFLIDETKEILNEDHYDFIQSINSSSEFMLRMVEDLLDYTKIETGNINLDKEKSDIVSFISSCIKRNQVLANRKDVTIQFESNIDEHELEFDKNKFEQVINNLLSNAVKFSNNNSVVTVQYKKTSENSIISVTDSGKGIKPENIDRIFIPFDRKASSLGTSGEKSTGLGLSISKKIVESHGGTLSVKSELGKGSTFIITLTN